MIILISFTIDSLSIQRGIFLLFEHDKNHNCDFFKIIHEIDTTSIVLDNDEQFKESKNLKDFMKKIQKIGKLKSIGIVVENIDEKINISIIQYVFSTKHFEFLVSFCYDRSEIIIEKEDIEDIKEISYRNPHITKKDKKRMKLFDKYLY